MTDSDFLKFSGYTSTSLPDGGTPLAVYVHWPWCLKKCPYCDFNSHVLADRPSDDYTAALVNEAAHWREKTGPRRLVSVFFGGGTPSLMGAERIGRVLEALERAYGLPQGVEVTVECNPTSSPAALFKDLVGVGVNRVSIGVQSFQDNLLSFLGREHGAEAALKTLETALETIGNANADVIYGLPEQDLGLFLADLKRLEAMKPQHISAYQLTIEPNTAFYGAVRKGAWQPLDGDRQADFSAETQALLTSHGYRNYEISNFAQPGLECRHNLHIWQYGDYLGLGAGAHGRVRLADGTRIATAVRKDPMAYLRQMSTENQAFSLWHDVDATEAAQEAFIMGLRLADGVDVVELGKVIPNIDWQRAVRVDEIEAFASLGLLMHDNRCVKTTAHGWWHLNRILRDIIR